MAWDMSPRVTMTENGPQAGNIALKGLFVRKGIGPSLVGADDGKGAKEQILIVLAGR